MDIKLRHSQLRQLKPRELAVLVLMMQSADKEGATTISLRELARLGEWSFDKVRRDVEKLKELGVVKLYNHTTNHTTNHTSSIYIIDCSSIGCKDKNITNHTTNHTANHTAEAPQITPQVPTMQIIEDAVVIEDDNQAKKEKKKESNKESTKEIYKERNIKERKEQEEKIIISEEITEKEKNIFTKGAMIPEEYEESVIKWLRYKKEKGSTYKSSSTIETMVNHLIKMSGGNPDTAMKIVEQSIVNNWQGLFELKNGFYKTRQEREFERRMQQYATILGE